VISPGNSQENSLHALEEGQNLSLDFDRFKTRSGVGVIPVAVQDVDTKTVLLIGHANRAALEHALEKKVAAFWSVSRNKIWVKGETSGNVLDLIEVRVNCEQNSLLYLVKLRKGGACHTQDSGGRYRLGCYYRKIKDGRLEHEI
jgi:phosphoribosyl-AMP cyclohydrolase